jgi:hypothetical protein
MPAEEVEIKEHKEKHEHEESDSDDDHGHDHDHEGHDHEGHDHKQGDEDKDGKKANRGEKKFKKSMQKLGLKQVTGITRVTIRKGKSVGYHLLRVASPLY